MAQPKVNDFFLARKRRDAHPAKRRKVEVPIESANSSTSDSSSLTKPSSSISNLNTVKSLRSQSKTFEESCPPEADKDTSLNFGSKSKTSSPLNMALTPSFEFKKTESAGATKLVEEFQASSSSNEIKTQLMAPRLKKSQSKQTRKSRKDTRLRNQTKITELLLPPRGPGAPALTSDSASSNLEFNLDVKEMDTLTSRAMVISEMVTSIADDHDHNPEMITPRKQKVAVKEGASEEPPRTRKCKMAVRKAADSYESEESKSAKKRLDLEISQTGTMASSIITKETSTGTMTKIAKDSSEPATSIVNEKGKPFLIRLMSEVESPDKPLSPLPVTPEFSDESSTPESREDSLSPKPASPKLQNLSQKLKALSQMNGKALKNRLKQSGKLDDVKKKVDDLKKTLDKKAELEKDVADVDAVVTPEKEKLPAYQRFEHLAKEGIPTLSLPASYKTLEGTFQAMDTVVSMLHNRSELCTFSKLKAAVQNFTKKNFEERAVGQIKTVAPDAYIFRQEKNVCTSGGKKGYTLTVEADLSKEVPDDANKKIAKTSDGKPVFTASALISRKQKFHKNLLGLIMKQHKEFLASLSPPLTIPESKITRWHPRFPLDKIPAVTQSPLPQPPDIKVYHSAKDVLQAQQGRLNPRVEEALAKVASENENKKSCALSNSPSTKSSEAAPSSAPASPSMKGIPAALLAKIRAKEALKMEQSLTRDPEEENKTKMMSHLPEMIRIIRSYFVTEKRPALPLESVYKKLEESYRSGISRKDVEQHIKLLASLAPELVSLVEIKKGHFIKFDRNVDVQAVSTRITKLVEERK